VLDLRTAFVASLFVDIGLVWAALGILFNYGKRVTCTPCWLIAFVVTSIGHGL
jgi:hypothetical protein